MRIENILNYRNMAGINKIPEGIKASPVSPEAKKSALNELMSGDFMTKIKTQISELSKKIETGISSLKNKNSPEKIETPKAPESVQPKSQKTTPESEIIINPDAPYQVSGESTTNTNSTGMATDGTIGGGLSGSSVSGNPPSNFTANSF